MPVLLTPFRVAFLTISAFEWLGCGRRDPSMAKEPSQHWFEMPELRRRKFANAVWVPLRAMFTFAESGSPNQPGYQLESFYAKSLAIPLQRREEAEALGWMDLGIAHALADVRDAWTPLAHDQTEVRNPWTLGPFVISGGIPEEPPDLEGRNFEHLGVQLVLEQNLGPAFPIIWHLNQDITFALNLVEDRDAWVRPYEEFVPVVRTRKGTNGQLLEIRSEFLRDYLASRNMALRLSYFHRRMAVLNDPSYLAWSAEGLIEQRKHDRFQARIVEIGPDGTPWGKGYRFLWQASRLDIDPGEDVPVFAPDNEANSAGRWVVQRRKGSKFYRAEGRLRREEWIDPLDHSERVRGDKPAESAYFIADASGARLSLAVLNEKGTGRYLWFSPRVISTISAWRSARLQWHTKYTGAVLYADGSRVFFGVNRLGLVNVHTSHIARLYSWQQRFWAGHNIAPDGGVSDELLASQMGAGCETRAPEDSLALLMRQIDVLFGRWIGGALFKSHDIQHDLLLAVHRFRALDGGGLLALAKDVARLTADRIDIEVLRKVARPPTDQRWGSLKSLERCLATVIPEEQARSILTPLVGVYELRLGDAHLPSSRLSEAFAMVGIDPTAPYVEQGLQLLESTAIALNNIAEAVSQQLVAHRD